MYEQGELTMDVVATVTGELSTDFAGLKPEGSIHAGTVSQQDAEANAYEAAGYRREVALSSPCVCIDGRCRNENQIAFELGPHIAGGAMTLLVAAEAVNHPFRGAEMLKYASNLRDDNDPAFTGFDLRAHDDDTNRAAGYANGTGCGANDKLPAIGVNFRENKDAIAGVLQALMGDDFDAAVYDGLVLPEPSEEEWDKNFLRQAVGAENVENLHDDHEGVHGHREQQVIFNFVPGTTIDRDAYAGATGKQAFVVDAWYIKELANRLATGINADAQARAMEHAMIAYQVATYLTLCDGSHRAAVLRPAA